MKPTDVSNPNYFHKVVDCQWACPAHTDIPEYIRLIALGRYTDAYMLNRESNVFPGILGRVCDRPCEPACRRGRLDQKPVAICRLKRVAADLRGEIAHRLPKIPKAKNGKRIVLIGAGCASLTVANDLLPLGYEITMFEQLGKTGGLMRTNIPAFRLPAEVLDEEINTIVDLGVDLRLGAPINSLKALLQEDYDAVFVGTGAPKGRNLEIPGRYDTDQIFVGIQWLESVAFGHVDSIGERVIIIGGGNTGMDCCRTSLRIGGEDVKVVARSFSGDKQQLVPLIKAGLMHQGFAMLDVISPCVTFNDHDGSTKSYVYTREHFHETIHTDFVLETEEIRVNYGEGEVVSVQLHDGSRVLLRKVAPDYEPKNRGNAISYIQHRQEKGEIVTGLLYLDEQAGDLHAISNTIDQPLNEL